MSVWDFHAAARAVAARIALAGAALGTMAVLAVARAAPAAAPAEDIRDIRGPLPVASPWVVWACIGGALLAVFAAYLLWRWIKRRRSAPPIPDFEVALSRLEAARSLMQPGRGREFSIEVSAIVREYIEGRFHVMAAHRTTNEFLRDLVSSAAPALAAHRDLLGEFLQSCDLAKFGGWNLTVEQMNTMLESARRFIESASAAAAVPAGTATPPTFTIPAKPMTSAKPMKPAKPATSAGTRPDNAGSPKPAPPGAVQAGTETRDAQAGTETPHAAPGVSSASRKSRVSLPSA